MKLKITGLKEMKHLEKNLKRTMRQFNGNIPLEKIFTAKFLIKYTSYSDIYDWMKAGGFTINNQEDFDNIDESQIDEYVCTSTAFHSWQDMLDAAAGASIEASLDR